MMKNRKRFMPVILKMNKLKTVSLAIGKAIGSRFILIYLMAPLTTSLLIKQRKAMIKALKNTKTITR